MKFNFITKKNKSLLNFLSRKLRYWDIVSWGRKHPLLNLIRKPSVFIEDGFIRSINVTDKYSFSYIIDRKGIHYDYRSSELHDLIKSNDYSSTDLEIANQAINLICNNSISKYNQKQTKVLDFDNTNNVLIVLQCENDLSLNYSTIEPSSNTDLIRWAIAENPNSTFIIKKHPADKKPQLYLNEFSDLDITYLSENINPNHLFSVTDKVYTISSQFGFEALMFGKDVHCMGLPFYAGYGLTTDLYSTNKRINTTRTLTEIFIAAYIKYSHYIDPNTGVDICIIDAINAIIEINKCNSSTPSNSIFIGFSPWKKKFLSQIFSNINISFRSFSWLKENLNSINISVDIYVWGVSDILKHNINIRDILPENNVYRVEDGFVRSADLGSNLSLPMSLVFDSTGIYFDPASPSDLENIIKDNVFTAKQNDEATTLMDTIVSARVSKYNMDNEDLILPATNKVIIFIPGQVTSDASIQLGSKTTSTNRALLKKVRETNPTAYIIYKPHPDTSSGNRQSDISNIEAQEYCDLLIISASIPDCIDVADEVHVMSSLVGMEALMRRSKVVCYGSPFYAGWGLTTDLEPLPRRRKDLSIEELFHCTYIQYPKYFNYNTGLYTSLSNTIDNIKNTTLNPRKSTLINTFNKIIRRK